VMKSKHHIEVALIVTALVLGGCSSAATPEPTKTPTAAATEPPIEMPDPTDARDAVLAYLAANHPDQAPAVDLTWTEEDITPKGLIGSSIFLYTADSWEITAILPIVAPENTVYQVSAFDQTTGFHWEGEVDALGEVTELSASEAQGDYWPPSPRVCSDMADSMAQTLGVEATPAEAPFTDYITGMEGSGCQIVATGMGGDLDYMAVADTLAAMFRDQGWQEDKRYAADGPTGTGTAFRKENGLCLVTTGWEPSEDADCPDDQPISACELEPEQQFYTITLNCAYGPPVGEL